MNAIISLAYISLPVYPPIVEPWRVNLSNPETYSELCQISRMEFFCENSQWLKAVNYFLLKTSSQIFDWILNTHLYSATHCLGKLRMLIRMTQLQHKFIHFKIQT